MVRLFALGCSADVSEVPACYVLTHWHCRTLVKLKQSCFSPQGILSYFWRRNSEHALTLFKTDKSPENEPRKTEHALPLFKPEQVTRTTEKHTNNQIHKAPQHAKSNVNHSDVTP